MKRHAKKLQRKSRTHTVELTSWGWLVTSGSSGKEYAVRELADGRFWCGCKWHEYHTYGECSHVAAVREWLAGAGERRIYLHDSVESVKRAHARFEDSNDGITYTSRRLVPRTA